MRITAAGRELIDALLDEYTAETSRSMAGKAIRRYVRVPLTNNQYSALVSFVMCEGIEVFKKSQMLKLINASKKDWHKFIQASNQFDFYIYSIDEKGLRKPDQYLIKHRHWEKSLFLTPEAI